MKKLVKNMIKRAPYFLLPVLTLIAMSVLGMTLAILYLGHWHGPFRDMWEIFPFLEKIIENSWGLSDLWQAYGGSHRLFIPKLLYIIDYQFFSANNHFLIGVSVFCQAIICWVFYQVLKQDNSLPRYLVLSLTLVVITFQYSATLLFNFMHTFDVQWFLTCCFIVCAFYYLLNKGAVYPLVSAGFIVAACLCNLAAMAAWPVWLMMIYFQEGKPLKLSLFKMTPWLCLMLIMIAVLGQGISSGMLAVYIKNAAFYEIPLLPLFFLIILPLQYLANPLTDIDYMPVPYWAAAITFALVLYLFIFIFNFLLRRIKTSRVELFLSALALFAYGVAVMTLIGRGYDLRNAYAWRYQNIVMLFWSAMLLLIFLRSSHFSLVGKRFSRIAIMGVFVAYLSVQPAAWNDHLLLAHNVQRGHLALMMGFSFDVPMIAPTLSRSKIYVEGYNLEKERLLHEERRLGVYYGDLGRYWLEGILVSSIKNTCHANVDVTKKEKGSYQRMTVHIPKEEVRDYHTGLLVTNGGRIIGAAIKPLARRMQGIFQKEKSLNGYIVKAEEDNKKKEKIDTWLVLYGNKSMCKKRV